MLTILFVAGVTCRIIGLSTKPLEKQLFLSRHVVTETEEFEGGVLVDKSGVIEAVLKKDAVDLLLGSERSRNWKVSATSMIESLLAVTILLEIRVLLNMDVIVDLCIGIGRYCDL